MATSINMNKNNSSSIPNIEGDPNLQGITEEDFEKSKINNKKITIKKKFKNLFK